MYSDHSVSLLLESSGEFDDFDEFDLPPAFLDQMWQKASNIREEWSRTWVGLKIVCKLFGCDSRRANDSSTWECPCYWLT